MHYTSIHVKLKSAIFTKHAEKGVTTRQGLTFELPNPLIQHVYKQTPLSPGLETMCAMCVVWLLQMLISAY